jgi:hypothetical protein
VCVRHWAGSRIAFWLSTYLSNPSVSLVLAIKRSWFATIVVTEIELLRRVSKGELDFGRFRLIGRSASALWNAVLAVE